MKQDLTDITIVLDSSGSMLSLKTDTLGGLETFVQEQKKAPGKAALSLWTFSDSAKLHCSIPDLQAFEPVTEKTYLCCGNTALLDAVAKAITHTGDRLMKMPEANRPAKVIFVIMTDGLENASRLHSHYEVAEMVKHQQEVYKWEFVFIGANQDAFMVARGMNIPQTNAIQYAANPVGTSNAIRSASANAVKYRVGAAAGMAFNEADYLAQKKAGV